MKWFFAAFLLVLFAGCVGPALKMTTINSYKVDLLFEVDDCRVYRFEDNGNYHYFVTRTGGETISPRNDAPSEVIHTR